MSQSSTPDLFRTPLQEWNTENVIQWIQENMSTEYHASTENVIERVRQRDIDGKLLHQCLMDADAKTSLLRYLFPNSSDTFLALSLLRKLEKSQSTQIDRTMTDVVIRQQSPPTQSSSSQCVCRHCGASLSALLIDNHERHCIKQPQSSPQPVTTATTSSSPYDVHSEAKKADASDTSHVETIPCAFCEIPFASHLINEHEIYCGSRTEECGACGMRDTLFRLKNNMHECTASTTTTTTTRSHQPQQQPQQQQYVQYRSSDGITYDETALDINNEAHQQWIPLFERHLYDLQTLLYDRFVVNYKDASSHFAQFDAFGNKTTPMYQQKTNQQVSRIRTFGHVSNGGAGGSGDNLSNESRHKFMKTDAYHDHGKTKDELRKDFADKLTKIQNLLRKILENIVQQPFNVKYRTLRCSNVKLQNLLFCYSPVCEFLKLCGFVYVVGDDDSKPDLEHACYKLSRANHAKLKLAIGVLKYASDSFQATNSKQEYAQNEWERNQAYNRNDKSIFFGSWSCKRCNHLNKKTSVCKKCKMRKKHSLLKEQRDKEKQEIDVLSVERWICGLCGNRNAVQLTKCDNCKQEKVVTPPYDNEDNHLKTSRMKRDQSNDKNTEDESGLYLDDDEWM